MSKIISLPFSPEDIAQSRAALRSQWRIEREDSSSGEIDYHATHRENMLYHLKAAYQAEESGSQTSAMSNIELAAMHASIFNALSLLNKS